MTTALEQPTTNNDILPQRALRATEKVERTKSKGTADFTDFTEGRKKVKRTKVKGKRTAD